MILKAKGTFAALDPNASIFVEIKKQQPIWWTLFRSDKELYIEIRKDNYINVYYLGGAIAKICYKNGFKAELHQKYLGDIVPRGKSSKGKDKYEYDVLDLSIIDKNRIEGIKKNIAGCYVPRVDSEKRIQGNMILGDSNYIDSEFQFNQDPLIGKLRIDLIKLTGNVLTFIELKVISDSRLRNDEKLNTNIPEIIKQMEKYKLFINKYETNIIDYYKKHLEIKKSLGLTSISFTNLTLNKTPKLIIADTYTKMSIGREKRIRDIKKILDKHNIDYEIVK